MPSFDGGDDFVWIGGPGEGLWVVVDLGEEAVDGELDADDGRKTPRFRRRFESFAKKPSTALSQKQ